MKARKKLVLAALIASAMAVSNSHVLASSAATIFAMPANAWVTYDNASGSYPVITSILSQPGTVNGRTYTGWSFLAKDASGSLDIFNSNPLPGGYTPMVGDAISVTGTNSPFHQIPEIAKLTSIGVMSSGNAVPAVGVSSIPTLNQATLPQSVAGDLWELDNVTISGISGTFDGLNLTGTITDSSNNSMTLYYWPTSYSVENQNMSGMAIPTGPVNMTGFVSVYGGITEFTPMTISAVPEPTTFSLSILGGLALLRLKTRRS